MQSKLTRLFFSTARKVARLQRNALRAGLPPWMDPLAPKRAKPKPRPKPVPKPVLKTKTKTKAKTTPKAFPSKPALKAEPRATSPARTAKRAAPAARHPADAPFTPDPQAFAGAWRAHIYRTPPVPGAWPVRLSYFVYVPPRLAKGGPMLVMLHGCEQSALDFAWGTRMHREADREGVLLVYPQQSRQAQRHRCWHWYQPDAAHGYAEADAIAGILRGVAAEYGVDTSRIYIAGLSAGASMAALVALRHPRWIAALGMHSGAVLGAAHSAAEGLRVMRHGTRRSPEQTMPPLLAADSAFPGMPAIIVQGGRDAVVDPRSGRQLLEQLAWANGIGLEKRMPPREYGAGTPGAYTRTEALAGRDAVVALCLVPGLGHAWSGGDGRVRFHARQGPDASQLLWRFFRNRRRLPAPAFEP
ncbi:extracellular catalytic domain type 1 short-chain-length polyhydroxyalkanoate depolymerase [Bordetella genomosp. 9]|nr:PHB depolymerase family esterase [Bordetella genomosp. 9]